MCTEKVIRSALIEKGKV